MSLLNKFIRCLITDVMEDSQSHVFCRTLPFSFSVIKDRASR